MATAESTDRRRLRGMRTRRAILAHAARVGSAEGLDAVSLQRLANDLGISKSGLFAHFGSKEELQLATIETAGVLFAEQVIEPTAAAPTALDRRCRTSSAASFPEAVSSGRLRRSTTASVPGLCGTRCWRRKASGLTR